MYKDIQAMHAKFGISGPTVPTLLNGQERQFRIIALTEELNELIDATTIEDQIDALVDIVVFALGAAEKMGVNWDAHWHEVLRANMSKELANSATASKRGYKLDLIKPEGWKGPDHSYILKGN